MRISHLDSTKLRRFPFARPRTQTLTRADHRHRSGIAALAAVLCHCAGDFDFVTEFHGRASPATSLEAVRWAHFEAPVFDRSVGYLHVHVEPHMGIRPFNLCYETLHRYWLAGIELRCKRVVCDGGRLGKQNTKSEGK